MTSRRLYVVNNSTNVDTADTKKIVAAVNKQLRDHVAPAWHGNRVVVEYHTGDLATVQDEVPVGSWVLALLDNPDQAGVLGWHWTDDKDRVYSEVFTEPSIKSGSGVLTGGPYPVAATVSHEACETYGDQFCNDWSDTGRGLLVAKELSDPVEADSYEIDGVSVSNFVLPEWFDPTVSAGEKFDYLGRTTKPFSMSKGGYWVQMPAGSETQKFGRTADWMHEVGFDVRDTQGGTQMVFSPEMPEWRREAKMRSGRNTVRREIIAGSNAG